ncbi:hypothetical protein [Candidatus Nitrotoga sp. AM1P]|uniref:hypothetical protein n=1 Tax=Candidatus Nitrotoga sp. AM1P TaxID=2559597 RepID=UPI0015659972|nr:hypothetical protein [Candidatus Nitrotoga sp. AM1P]
MLTHKELRGNKRLHRFTLRGKIKVDGQWKLDCIMHKLYHFVTEFHFYQNEEYA